MSRRAAAAAAVFFKLDGFLVRIVSCRQVVIMFAWSASISVHSSHGSKILQKISTFSRDHSAESICRTIRRTVAPSQSVASAPAFSCGWRRRWIVRRPDSRQQSDTILFAALFAIIFEVNLPVAVVTTLYSNPLTILPIYMAAYAIGAFVTGNGTGNMPQTELHLMDKDIREWIPALMDWVVSLGKPLLLGMFLLALLLSLAGYLLVRGGWRLYTIHEWRKRAKRRAGIKHSDHVE